MAKKRLQKKREATKTAASKSTAPVKEAVKVEAETAKVETKKVEPVKVETKKVEPAKVETTKTEPVKVETKKVDAVKVETSKTEPVKVETKKVEPVKVETTKTEPLKVETAKTESVKIESHKEDTAKVETSKTEAPKVSAKEAAAKIPARDDDAIYCERLSRHLDELKWLYCELYQDNPYVTMHLNDLLTVLKKFYDMRSNDLKESDIRRAKDPKWYKRNDLTGMMMYVNAFAGTLSGLEKKLDYVQECHVNYLHLMPLLESPKGRSDGGYAVADFRKVQEELGNMDDFAHLTSECHKRGISVCLDFVMNHTSEDHEWAKRARAGEREYQDRYFFFDSYDIPSLYEQTCPQVFPTTAPGNFTWLDDIHKHVMTTFYPYQWDLNYANPAVFVDMTKSILHLANLGVEVFRIDAVPYIWKQLGTTCRNLPQVHTIVRMLRMVLECVCPAVILKGEVVMAPKELAAYFGTPEKPECHMLYNVSTMVNLWGALASRDTRLLKAQLDALHALPDNCWFVNYLRCHDDIGWGLDEAVENRLGIDPQKHKEYLYHFYEGNFPGSWAKGELYNYDPATGDARSCGTTASLCGVEQALEKGDKTALDYAVKRDLLLHTAMAFLQGFPMLNCGDEIAQLNGWDYKNDPDRVEDSRNLHRTKFNWENAKQRTRKGTLQNQLWQGMEQLRQMRADPCFAPDAWVTTWDSHNPGVLALVRKRGEETLVGLFNFTEYPAGASLDALGGKYTTADGKTVWLADVELQPYQALLVKKA